MKTANGVLIIKQRVISPEQSYVLCVQEKANSVEFVSWLMDSTGNCYHGFYSNDLNESLEHFDARGSI